MQATPKLKECTLMFYFASDNPLAISIVSQLKAIKSAGHHPEANVIVHFDPVTEGTPTHIFDVNVINKILSDGKSQVGFNGNDPFVRNLIEDRLWGKEEKNRNGDSIRDKIASLFPGYNPPDPAGEAKKESPEEAEKETLRGRKASDNNGKLVEPSPEKSLHKFLKLCSEKYPAKRYLLFILGHGVVVGNDVFLFDENAEEHTLKLEKLGNLLEGFNSDIKQFGGKLDLVGFHSCSVSSLEVAYELRGRARYMLASQGTAFVGSWPYKQILMRVFNDLDVKKTLDDRAIRELLEKIFSYCLHNSADFLLAGYPFDLCLCDLEQLPSIEGPLQKLSKALIDGLNDEKAGAQCANLVLLAHWKSQSFYQEMYTDLYDFCLCLSNYINEYPAEAKDVFYALDEACKGLMAALEPDKGSRSDAKLIVRSEFAGPEYQYARGLSLYFPWSAPPANRGILEEYAKYRITAELAFEAEDTKWLSFLKAYLEKTMREPRSAEQGKVSSQRTFDRREEVAAVLRARDPELYEDMVNLIYTQEGQRHGPTALDQRSKTDPKDPTGGDCSCPSIKNYPRDTRRLGRRKEQEETITFSQSFFAQSAF